MEKINHHYFFLCLLFQHFAKWKLLNMKSWHFFPWKWRRLFCITKRIFTFGLLLWLAKHFLCNRTKQWHKAGENSWDFSWKKKVWFINFSTIRSMYLFCFFCKKVTITLLQCHNFELWQFHIIFSEDANIIFFMFGTENQCFHVIGRFVCPKKGRRQPLIWP